MRQRGTVTENPAITRVSELGQWSTQRQARGYGWVKFGPHNSKNDCGMIALALSIVSNKDAHQSACVCAAVSVRCSFQGGA
jgi:hypothetical protein